MTIRRFMGPLSFLFIAAVLSGCASTPKIPIKLDPTFESRNIQNIVFMPIVDRRIDKKVAINLENDIRKPIKKMLEKKGYYVVTADNFGEGVNVTDKDIGEMDVNDLSDFGPAGVDNILYVYIDDVAESYIVLAYTFKIETTGSLIQKKEKLELWRDKGIGASGQGGLISGVVSGLDKYSAIEICLNSMISSLPKSSAAQTQKSKSARNETAVENTYDRSVIKTGAPKPAM